MIELFPAPRRYIQRKGISKRSGEFVSSYGNRPLFLMDQAVLPHLQDILSASLEPVHTLPRFTTFGGECCRSEIDRVCDLVRGAGLNVLVGVGGGKALDTAKAAGFYSGCPVITIPTSAATCAAWSDICPLYTEDGVYLETLRLERNPDLVLVDPEIIVRAPARLLTAGMGDALAKWYEGRISLDERGDASCRAAINLSKMARDMVKDYGPKARKDAEAQTCSRETERIIEVNILLTGLIGGIGGRRCRSAIAHAVNYALTTLKAARTALHGERVGFGLIVQLVLERNERGQWDYNRELIELMELYVLLKLPLTLREIGLKDSDTQALRRIASLVCRNRNKRYNLPFPINEDMLYEAMIGADRLGKDFIKGLEKRELPIGKEEV